MLKSIVKEKTMIALDRETGKIVNHQRIVAINPNGTVYGIYDTYRYTLEDIFNNDKSEMDMYEAIIEGYCNRKSVTLVKGYIWRYERDLRIKEKNT